MMILEVRVDVPLRTCVVSFLNDGDPKMTRIHQWSLFGAAAISILVLVSAGNAGPYFWSSCVGPSIVPKACKTPNPVDLCEGFGCLPRADGWKTCQGWYYDTCNDYALGLVGKCQSPDQPVCTCPSSGTGICASNP